MFPVHKPDWHYLGPTQRLTNPTSRASLAYSGWDLWLYQDEHLFKARWLAEGFSGYSQRHAREYGADGYWKGPHDLNFGPAPCQWAESFGDNGLVRLSLQLSTETLKEASLAIQEGKLECAAVVLGDKVFAQAQYHKETQLWTDFTGRTVSGRNGWLVQLPNKAVPDTSRVGGPTETLW